MTYRDPYRLNQNVRCSSPAGVLEHHLIVNREIHIELVGTRIYLRDCAAQRRMSGDVYQRVRSVHTQCRTYRVRQVARRRHNRKVRH